MRKGIRQRRLVSYESDPEPEGPILIGALVRALRGPTGEVIGVSRTGKLLVRWHGMSAAITTMHVPAEVVLIENPGPAETEAESE